LILFICGLIRTLCYIGYDHIVINGHHLWHCTVEIQRLTNIDNWRHVPGQGNPADSLSRSVMPNLLHNLEIWWSGPLWLKLNRNKWFLEFSYT